jgi:hypothetical protein
VCFIVRKTTSELEHVILTILYFFGVENTNNIQEQVIIRIWLNLCNFNPSILFLNLEVGDKIKLTVDMM